MPPNVLDNATAANTLSIKCPHLWSELAWQHHCILRKHKQCLDM